MAAGFLSTVIVIQLRTSRGSQPLRGAGARVAWKPCWSVVPRRSALTGITDTRAVVAAASAVDLDGKPNRPALGVPMTHLRHRVVCPIARASPDDAPAVLSPPGNCATRVVRSDTQAAKSRSDFKGPLARFRAAATTAQAWWGQVTAIRRSGFDWVTTWDFHRSDGVMKSRWSCRCATQKTSGHWATHGDAQYPPLPRGRKADCGHAQHWSRVHAQARSEAIQASGSTQAEFGARQFDGRISVYCTSSRCPNKPDGFAHKSDAFTH
jgi:hypothetical protein